MAVKRSTLLVQGLLLAAVLIVINLLAGAFFFRVDLTAEKRYTLAPETIKTLDTLARPLHIKVYLEGEELPARLKRYRDAIKTTLMEMKAQAAVDLQFEFIDPAENKGVQRYLADNGVTPLPIAYKSGAESVTRWLYPGAVITYSGKEQVVNLLKSDCNYTSNGTSECDYVKAESEIEYKLVSQLQRLVYSDRRIVGFLEESGTYLQQSMLEFRTELEKFYRLVPVNCKNGTAIPASKRFLPDSIARKIKGDGIDVLIVAQPDSALTERQKYEIDQYIMMGGRVLWLLDMMKIDKRDFYTEHASTLSTIRDLRLEDMFMKYGFKVNSDFVQDDMAGLMDVTFTQDNRPIVQPRKWTYFPFIRQFEDHPVSKNIDAVLMRYASSIDTLPAEGSRKRIICRSSSASRALTGPVLINLNQTIAEPPPRSVYKNKGNRILGLSVEGKLTSLFMGREAPVDKFAPNKPTAKFIPRTPFATKMVVFSDGALALPNVAEDYRGGGKDMLLDNKTLLMNAVAYLIGKNALTDIQARDVKLRLLDPVKVRNNEIFWRSLNLGLPVIIVVLFGILRHYWRRRRYGKSSNA